MAFHPYLFFGGNCRDAFTRYGEIFGGEVTILTMADAPGGDGGEVPPGKEDYVIHAAIVGGDALLMGSDDPMSDDFGPVQGMMVTYGAKDVDDANRVFDALSEGGQVNQELIETFFSPAFGMCVDRFGTPWMVSTDPVEEG
jgi:PhnB protein